jgi:predicted glycosyl hydrolase (DUF1957 family)
MHKDANILAHAASDVKIEVSRRDALDYFSVDWSFQNAQVEEAPVADARIWEHLERFVSLLEC